MKSAVQSLPVQEIPPEGLDPAASVWVSASAGSGKTTLLVKRVLRLLLEGQGQTRRKAPRILCLTYTRAASAEMHNRVQAELADWAIQSDDNLHDILFREFSLRADKEKLKHARRLFGQTLERPEMVRVLTIHAFCQMVLNRFPLEAGISPHFTLLEGDRLAAFQKRVLEAFLRMIPADKELHSAFETLSRNLGPARLRKTLEQIFYDAQAWEKFFETHPSPSAYEETLCREIEVEEVIEEEALLGPLCHAPALNEARLKWLAGVLSDGLKTEKDCGEKIAVWLQNPETRLANFQAYAEAFLTKEGEIRKRLLTKATLQRHPEAAEAVEEEAMRVHALMHRLLGLRFLRRQAAWHQLFLSLWQVLQQMKQAEGRLTYDDLILRTGALLRNPGVAGWVLYKLDGGIDHLLVDEAQDTSPAQWDILFSLLEEFLSGEGAREDIQRTVFMVGDEKQSIYSFQGADRGRYLEAQRDLFEKLKAAGRHPQRVELKRSRRAPKVVLEYVDAVFAHDAARAGVSEAIRHESARAGEPSYVELWPPMSGKKPEFPAPWTPALTREEDKPSPVLLAENIAARLRAWLDEGWVLHSEQRPVAPGDVLILLQRRSQLLLPIVRALKDAHIPVAGVDRMVLTEQPAVQDVLSLCRFLLLPEDNLTLAEVLRGPLVRISDEQLYTLAQPREKKTLWQSLQEKSLRDPLFQKAADYLKALLSITDYVPPFALLNEVLFKPCPADAISGQHALIKRLGPDAVDPLEELLAAALMQEYEAPSLQLFVQAVARSEKESKRDQSKAEGQVRILTVHSAKGLEAPVVIMPDLARTPTRTAEAPALYWNEQGLPLCVSLGDDAMPLVAEAKDRARLTQEEEHRRLLYVALTRARDVLILCGLAENEKQQETPWHQFCRLGMEELKATRLGESEAAFWRYGDARALAPPISAGTQEKVTAVALPEWIRKPVETASEKRRFVNPSQVASKDEKILPPTARQAAFRRGQLLHRLLQMLPLAESAAREELAFEFLLKQSGENETVCRENVKEVMRVLHDPAFAPIFGSGSRAEVPVIGRVEGKRISGQIDRLVVTEKEVLIIDYKTNRPPPENVEDIPRQYRAQMAAYRLLLEKIYPGRSVRSALLWTHTLKLMELPEAFHEEGLAILRSA